jgi:hypothetical protein
MKGSSSAHIRPEKDWTLKKRPTALWLLTNTLIQRLQRVPADICVNLIHKMVSSVPLKPETKLFCTRKA